MAIAARASWIYFFPFLLLLLCDFHFFSSHLLASSAFLPFAFPSLWASSSLFYSHNLSCSNENAESIFRKPLFPIFGLILRPETETITIISGRERDEKKVEVGEIRWVHTFCLCVCVLLIAILEKWLLSMSTQNSPPPSVRRLPSAPPRQKQSK